MLARLASIHNAGNSVGYVTLLIGSNDIFALVNSAAFQGASFTEQEAMIAAAFGNIQTAYSTVLGQLQCPRPRGEGPPADLRESVPLVLPGS